jgi:putative FmdB family regulatory protein
MPFYEYECQDCKFYTEVMQKITDAPLTRCPSCGKRRMKKLVSAPVFRLKGGGWYETDFKSDKESKRNLLAEKEEPAPAAKAGGAEGKPAAAEGKDAKPAEGKSAEPKAGAPKAAADDRATGSSTKRVSVPVKGVRATVARRTARSARSRRPRGGRRR